jgi:hypothetical protein
MSMYIAVCRVHYSKSYYDISPDCCVVCSLLALLRLTIKLQTKHLPAQQQKWTTTATETMKTTLFYDRYDWYQTDSRVVVTILVKNRTSDDVKCDIQDTYVSLYLVVVKWFLFYLDGSTPILTYTIEPVFRCMYIVWIMMIKVSRKHLDIFKQKLFFIISYFSYFECRSYFCMYILWSLADIHIQFKRTHLCCFEIYTQSWLPMYFVVCHIMLCAFMVVPPGRNSSKWRRRSFCKLC